MKLSPVALFAMTGLALASACGGGDDHPASPSGTGATGGASGKGAGGTADATAGSAGTAGGAAAAGADGSVTGGTGGSAGAAGADGAVGSAGATGTAICGNSIAEEGEQCDGPDLRGEDCTSFGYSSGTLTCTPTCELDPRKCTGTEICANGRDDDGDGLVDCADTDCAGACADPCASPEPLPDPTFDWKSDTTGHASTLAPSCVRQGASSGPEVVYQFTAGTTGLLDARLTAAVADLDLSVRTSCGDASSELGCSETITAAGGTEWLRVSITQGQSVFIVVDGDGNTEQGTFTLNVRSRTVVCGDGIRDPGEQCDDHNTVSGDGCSATCTLESDETEPNGTTADADPYTAPPFVASIDPTGDVDVFAVDLPNPNSTLTVQVKDLGDGSCANLTLDSYLELIDTNGTVLASNDDYGTNYCSRAQATGLAAGKYFIRVKASGQATTFPYLLDVTVQ